jgi:RNA polymerase primary sigma factor/RNA polymerase sporulation-specific sigma factor
MLDYIRKCASAIPASGSILSLDASPPGFDSEANVTYADILPDDYSKNPEQLFIRQETITEVRNALEEISDRERAYLHYRYGFVDDMSHDQTETASYFHLSLSRARHTEKAALNNVRRALPGQ